MELWLHRIQVRTSSQGLHQSLLSLIFPRITFGLITVTLLLYNIFTYRYNHIPINQNSIGCVGLKTASCNLWMSMLPYQLLKPSIPPTSCKSCMNSRIFNGTYLNFVLFLQGLYSFELWDIDGLARTYERASLQYPIWHGGTMSTKLSAQIKTHAHEYTLRKDVDTKNHSSGSTWSK